MKNVRPQRYWVAAADKKIFSNKLQRTRMFVFNFLNRAIVCDCVSCISKTDKLRENGITATPKLLQWRSSGSMRAQRTHDRQVAGFSNWILIMSILMSDRSKNTHNLFWYTWTFGRDGRLRRLHHGCACKEENEAAAKILQMEEVSVNRKHATCIVTASKLCTFDLLGPVRWVSLLPLDRYRHSSPHKKLVDGEKFSNIFFIYYFHQGHLVEHLVVFVSMDFFFRCCCWSINLLAAPSQTESERSDSKIHVKLCNHQRKPRFYSPKHSTK